ncbi:MerR family transcriptional regulator [Lutimaribacter sp. EGI FJ00015]|uniref:MerR family transcriptional regulator n=1 Tax=Lutimaribacter degradans TaxID=2945989 RepID=A0ACC5ZW66_9RHOB|nr:MerR family transcriptional regulator [Lutimaribacter sp. EGI FJ00013]MCM2562423.1 MerR family transcriptional regulator [Lutimaribacter sp. EGI FJ00013]MCO0613580.1 MerR family transcriptional regulator [Lutimaribacter sp. EGI FJ00015]MCO0636552.1 MerR family transcriptional regulator [Lutimaribacter sp. EGI FJ00014]
MSKSPNAFRTISEVAEWLDKPAHVLRFWESKFTQLKPVKRAGGRRYYRPDDMLLLGGIKKLLHDDGMTIKGVQKMLREKGVKHVSALSQPLDEVTRAVAQDDAADNMPDADELAQTTPHEVGSTGSQDAAPLPVKDDTVVAFHRETGPGAAEPDPPETPAAEATDTQDDAADGMPTPPAPTPEAEPTEAAEAKEGQTAPADSAPMAPQDDEGAPAPEMEPNTDKQADDAPEAGQVDEAADDDSTPGSAPVATPSDEPSPRPAIVEVPETPPLDQVTAAGGVLTALATYRGTLDAKQAAEMAAARDDLARLRARMVQN